MTGNAKSRVMTIANKLVGKGYLPKAVAYVVAPLLDKGESLKLESVWITGGIRAGFNLGARLQLAI